METLMLSEEKMRALSSRAHVVGIMCSKLSTPVGEQAVEFRKSWGAARRRAQAGRDDGLRASLTLRGARNPLNVFALLKVLEAVLEAPSSVLQMGAAVKLCAEKKAAATRWLRARRGYGDVEEYDANVNNSNKRDRIAKFLETNLNLIKLPVKFKDGGWLLSYIPNVPGASSKDVARTIEAFYEHVAPAFAAPRTLDGAAYRTIRGQLGLGAAPLLDFLVIGAMPKLAGEFGITAGRQKKLFARGEAILSAAETARNLALAVLVRKTKASSGEHLKQLDRAVAYRVKKSLDDAGLLRDAAQSNNAKERSLLETYPAIKETLHEIARTLLPSYKTNNATPVDQVLLTKMRYEQGGQVDYFYTALNKWAADHNPPFKVSRAATWSLMQEVGIFNVSHKSQAAGLVLSMHYCNSAVKLCRDLLNLFSAHSAIFSIDAKALYKCNKGISRSKGFQIVSERSKWARPDHDAGADHLGKLSLFCVYKLPVTTNYLATTDGLRDAAAEISGYDEEALFRERPGFAAAFAHVEDHERETAARNIGDLERFFTMFSCMVVDEDGSVCPFVGIETDNSHGASDRAACFCCGLFFVIFALSVLVMFSPAGKCSALNPVERVNGALSIRMARTPPIMLESETPHTLSPQRKSEVLESALQYLVGMTNGATFSGGKVSVVRADDISTNFEWRADEIAKFLKLSEEEKKTFSAPPMGSIKDPADLYRKVHHFMIDCDDKEPVFYLTAHTCVFRARDDRRDVHGWRGPTAMRDVLDKFGGGIPQSMVPSESANRPASYMRLEELLKSADVVRKLKPDQYHPDKLFKGDWGKIRKEWFSHPTGDLSEATWKSLCSRFRSEKEVVKHKILYELSLEEHAAASAAVETTLKKNGLWQSACTYVIEHSSTGKANVPDIREVLRSKHSATSSSLMGVHKAELLQKVVTAAKLASRQPAIATALAAAVEASSSAASHFREAEVAAEKLLERAPRKPRKRRRGGGDDDDDEDEEEEEEEDDDDDDDDDDDEEVDDMSEDDDGDRSSRASWPSLRPRSHVLVELENEEPPACLAKLPASFGAIDTTNPDAELKVVWLCPHKGKYTDRWDLWYGIDEDGKKKLLTDTIRRDNILIPNIKLTTQKRLPSAVCKRMARLPNVRFSQYSQAKNVHK